MPSARRDVSRLRNRGALLTAGELRKAAAGYNGAMRSEYTWRLRERELKLGERTLVMGVLNVTPDSFSEAGLHFSPQAAVEHGLRLLEEGADILDIGGESTRACAESAMSAGVERARMVLDPGFGFGKNFGENFALLARFGELHSLGFPLLAGTSRKSFIGRALARQGKDLAPTERLFGSVATAAAAILAGAHIVRAHDVRPTVEAAQMADEILKSGNRGIGESGN